MFYISLTKECLQVLHFRYVHSALLVLTRVYTYIILTNNGTFHVIALYKLIFRHMLLVNGLSLAIYMYTCMQSLKINNASSLNFLYQRW